jgi:molybdopterin converting factor subunit 1
MISSANDMGVRAAMSIRNDLQVRAAATLFGLLVMGCDSSAGDVVGSAASKRIEARVAVAYSFPMRVCVLYFAILKDVFGCEREELELPASTSVAGLLDVLGRRGEASGKVWGSIAVAVNQEYALADVMLTDGDEVALLPPVSGGGR